MKDEEDDENCSPWVADKKESETNPDTPRDETVTCVAYRRFEAERSQFTLKEGESYSWYVGYNVFDGEGSTTRVASGATEEIEIHMFEMNALTVTVGASLIYSLYQLL